MLRECLAPHWGISMADWARLRASSLTPVTSLPKIRAVGGMVVGSWCRGVLPYACSTAAMW